MFLIYFLSFYEDVNSILQGATVLAKVYQVDSHAC